MKAIRTSLVLLLCFILVLTVPTSLKARAAIVNSNLKNFQLVNGDNLVNDVAPNTNSSKTDVIKAFNEYGLKPININDIPKGTQVINFDSIGNFQKFMQIISQPNSSTTPDSKALTQGVGFSTNLITPLSMMPPQGGGGYTIKTVTLKKSILAGISCYINLYVTLHRNSSGTLTVYQTWTSQTGFTFALDWHQSYAYTVLNSRKTGGSAYGGGTQSWVIIVKGVGTVKSQDARLQINFSNTSF